jgi:hypothetical protein
METQLNTQAVRWRAWVTTLLPDKQVSDHGFRFAGMLAKTVRQLVEIPPVRKLCQNPICLGRRKLPFEGKQLPQVVDIGHTSIESMERLEPANILRNQQVAGSIPAGGSMFSITCRYLPFQNSDTVLTQQSFSARPVPKPRFG